LTKYAKRLEKKGFRIMELLLINDPVLNVGYIELPNEGSKLDFEKKLKLIRSFTWSFT
jgi:hypothetical protein